VQSVSDCALKTFPRSEVINQCRRIATDSARGCPERKVFDPRSFHFPKRGLEQSAAVKPSLSSRLLLFQHR
jgi:hypothetical protein